MYFRYCIRVCTHMALIFRVCASTLQYYLVHCTKIFLTSTVIAVRKGSNIIKICILIIFFFNLKVIFEWTLRSTQLCLPVAAWKNWMPHNILKLVVLSHLKYEYCIKLKVASKITFKSWRKLIKNRYSPSLNLFSLE